MVNEALIHEGRGKTDDRDESGEDWKKGPIERIPEELPIDRLHRIIIKGDSQVASPKGTQQEANTSRRESAMKRRMKGTPGRDALDVVWGAISTHMGAIKECVIDIAKSVPQQRLANPSQQLIIEAGGLLKGSRNQKEINDLIRLLYEIHNRLDNHKDIEEKLRELRRMVQAHKDEEVQFSSDIGKVTEASGQERVNPTIKKLAESILRHLLRGSNALPQAEALHSLVQKDLHEKFGIPVFVPRSPKEVIETPDQFQLQEAALEDAKEIAERLPLVPQQSSSLKHTERGDDKLAQEQTSHEDHRRSIGVRANCPRYAGGAISEAVLSHETLSALSLPKLSPPESAKPEDAADCAELYQKSMFNAAEFISLFEHPSPLREEHVRWLNSGGFLLPCPKEDFDRRIREGIVLVARDKSGKVQLFSSAAVVANEGRITPDQLLKRYAPMSGFSWEAGTSRLYDKMRACMERRTLVYMEDLVLAEQYRGTQPGNEGRKAPNPADTCYAQHFTHPDLARGEMFIGEIYKISAIEMDGRRVFFPGGMLNVANLNRQQRQGFRPIGLTKSAVLTTLRTAEGREVKITGYWKPVLRYTLGSEFEKKGA